MVSFTKKFEFTSEHPTIDVVLQIIKKQTFEEISVADMNFHQCSMAIHKRMQCYNLMGEPNNDDPLEIDILESEGICTV